MKLVSLTENDLPALLSIEQSVQAFPWSEKQMKESILLHQAMGLKFDGALCAYLIWQSVLDEAEILTIAVSKDCQHQGLAKQLLSDLFKRLHEKQIKRLHLEVAENNQAAIALYQQFGFVLVGRRKDYYAANVDAILMAVVPKMS